jgi:hypothetical protein
MTPHPVWLSRNPGADVVLVWRRRPVYCRLFGWFGGGYVGWAPACLVACDVLPEQPLLVGAARRTG